MLNHKLKFILLISVLLLSAFLITSFTSYFVSRESLRREIESNSLPLTSDNVYSEIQRDLIKPILISSFMANDTFLRDWVISGEKDVKQIQNYLNKTKIKYNAFTSFFVSEKTRNYYYYDGILKTVSPDAWRDKWYFRVRNMEPVYEINCDPDMANNDEMTIFVNHKVFDYDGNFIGATGVGLTANAVQILINHYQQKYNRTIYFVDRSGKVILGAGLDAPDKSNINNLPGISSVAGQILSSNTNTLIYETDGTTVHINTRFIPELQWYLIIEQPEEKIIEHISRALLINLAISLAVTGVTILLIHLAINAYRKRLHRMERETRAEIKQAQDASRKKEIAIGMEIQKQLLLGDPPQHVRGARIAATSIPSQQIGGDFYDFVQYDSKHFDLFMGDVMGKGITAALYGAATKIQFLRAFYDQAAAVQAPNLPSLESIANIAHQEMSEKLMNIESFITACVARIDIERGRLELIDCGHTETLLFRRESGECELIKGQNCPLGFLAEENYEVYAAEFKPGDILVFYSDGIIEAKNPGQKLFGVERLMEFIKTNSSDTPANLLHNLFKDLQGFAATSAFADDVTCIIVKFEE